MSKILLLTDVLDLRARQRKELAHYQIHKEKLERQIAALARDLQLTDHILRLITAEHKDELSIGKSRS
jgi:hypothetical protein